MEWGTMTTAELYIFIFCLVGLYVGVSLASVVLIPRQQFPLRSFDSLEFQLQYDDARNKARQTIAQIVLGAGFVFTFIAAAIGHANTIAENEAKMQKDSIDAYTASTGTNSISARVIQLDRLARIDPSGFHDIAYSDIIRSIRSSGGLPCGSSTQDEQIDTAVALALLADRRTENDRMLYLMLEDKCLTNLRLDRLGDGRSLGAGLRNGNFSGSQLHASDFSGLDLTGAFFMGVRAGDFEVPGWRDDTRSRNLQARGLNGEPIHRHQRRLYLLHFVGATLDRAQFQGANLAGADFSNARLDDARFDHANISRADFRGSTTTGYQIGSGCFGSSDHTVFDNIHATPIFNNDIQRLYYDGRFRIPLCGE
jgi:uncharacterized protein YjbI with pentapeptide repeats